MVDVTPPVLGLVGNSNYIIYGNGDALLNVTVTVDITEDLTGNIGFALQLNAYSPRGANSAWQQFFFSLQASSGLTTAPYDLYGIVETWPISGPDLINHQTQLLTRSTPRFLAGYKLTISLGNEANGNVRYVTFTVLDQNGHQVGHNSVDILTLTLHHSNAPVTEADLAPILAFTFNIVGPINGERTYFSSGAGTITYSASNELTVQNALPSGLDSNASAAENGNSVYGTLPQGPSTTVTQSFYTDGQLLFYYDFGTLGNVSTYTVVGSGAWQDFKFLFAGRNLKGENRIYAVDQNGQLLSYCDKGLSVNVNVSNPMVVGFGGWLEFKFLFAGTNLKGENRIYAVHPDGQLWSYQDDGTLGNVSSYVVVASGAWQDFRFLFAGRNLKGENRIYAVDQHGQLRSYGDDGTPNNVSRYVVVGSGAWLEFKFLFAGTNLLNENCIYAVDRNARLLSYGDHGTLGNVSNPMVVGFGGWLDFKFLFSGENLALQNGIYAVPG
jgi:hypothetical protein